MYGISRLRVKYSERLSVALVIQHAMRMRRIIYFRLRHVRLCDIFSYYLMNNIIFGGGKNFFEHEMCFIKCVSIFCTTFVYRISHSK
jgi:hypothetical protein